MRGSKDSRPRLRHRALFVASAVLLCLARNPGAAEPGPMTYIYNGPETANDVRYEYHWEILRAALEKTRARYGPYLMQRSKAMTEERQAHELMGATGELTVMYLDTRPEFEKNLIGIHIPVDKGLVGYRVFLIRADRRKDFRGIGSLDELRRFSFGLGLDWIDVAILRNSGFKVVTGSNYDGLFEMLVNRRFDVFLRGAVEVLDEVELRRTAMPELCIEDSLCLYYPLPMYFWFPRTEEGRLLAARAEEGMRAMIADGSYDLIFDHYEGRKIESLHLKDRRLFRIENPFLGPEIPFADKRLWFDPKTYSPKP
jgi:hypothetical protein